MVQHLAFYEKRFILIGIDYGSLLEEIMKALLYADTFPRLFQDMREHPGKWISCLVFLLGPWMAFWMVETLNENNIISDLQGWQVLMNMIWYYLLFALCRALLGRRQWAATAAMALSFVVGMVNHYVLRFRGRILFPADVAGWRTAANVADGFDFSMDPYITHAALLLVAYLSAVWLCVPQKKRDRMPRWLAGLLLVFGLGYSFAFFRTDMLPWLGIYTQQWTTQSNGFLLNFTVAMRYSSVDKPKGYSHDLVLELAEQYPAVEGDDSVTRPTNIIAIMNESFGDLTIFDGLELDEDPTPFLHSMEENTIKGLMYSPVTGGGTASVEYEYLTGFSTLFQPPHTVAYQLYVEDGMPSLSSLMGAEGYQTNAFHPYKSSGWNRPLTYQYMRFQNQYYQEDVKNPYMVRRYISDRSNYEKVFEITESAQGAPCFVFNVTMQNHSGYAQGWKNLEKTIKLSLRLNTIDKNAEQFFALMRESDKALEQLITYYSQVEEPTMIVFFGDHQPALKNGFYEALYGKALSERTTQEVLQQYAVPFFIWTNYDIQERKDVILSANYLGVLTAQTAGLPMTGYMNFLSRLYEQLPVITPVGFITGAGECLEEEELSQTQREWLHTYQVLNYCGMTDLFDRARPMFCAMEE